MDKPFFVILYCRNGSVTPMINARDELAVYGSRGEAVAAAKENTVRACFGFEVHEVGAGEGH